ncbi:MAG: transketolase family protein, partial [Candidatus Eremiobacteraeota bacterium]|nr:transketolase family protein [Candidatus Eremiobacteraeota bacterium]
GTIVTVEEHQKHAGMGSRVAEILAQRLPTPIEMVGVDDAFGQSGDPAELIEYYGMGAGAIVAAAKRAYKRKKA